MSRRTHLALAGAALLSAAVAVPATAQDGGKTTATLTARGGTTMKPNHSVTDTQRYSPGSVTIAPGGTLTVRDKTANSEPHTISLVKATQLPKTSRQIGSCFEGGPCSTIERAHTEGEEPQGPPKNMVVNVGKDGFDQPGDSAFFMKKAITLKVTAARGANLKFLCIIHPQMQGTIKVR